MVLYFRQTSAPVDEAFCQSIARLFERCFGQPPDADFRGRLNEKPRLLAILAERSGEPVGFKIGYEKYRGVFFSWLGGVHPDHRREGIARALLLHQHALCLDAGYREIQTETLGAGTGMLILNLQEGFEIFGTHLGDDNQLRVQLRKKLVR